MSNALRGLSVSWQLECWSRLESIRVLHLDEALSEAVLGVPLAEIDAELAACADGTALQRLAANGLRGEVFFAVPCLLRAKPALLGYYRMLLGVSQKEFVKHSRIRAFLAMEETGLLRDGLTSRLNDLVAALNAAAEVLVLGLDSVSKHQVHELQLLTYGPMLRGSRNNEIGRKAVEQVFELIDSLVQADQKTTTPGTIRFNNASGRPVRIAFASDPDILITEVTPGGKQERVSIEIKGGADASNQHNRLGEAEKSHQKAKLRGCFEFWTICRVAPDEGMAKSESPTTSRFFSLDAISANGSPEQAAFRDILRYTLGLTDD